MLDYSRLYTESVLGLKIMLSLAIISIHSRQSLYDVHGIQLHPASSHNTVSVPLL